MVPTKTAALLAHHDTSELPGTLAIEIDCQGAKFHSPNPLVLRQVDTPRGLVWLCGNCEANLAVYQAVLAHDDRWPIRREFGNRLRALADS